MENKNLAIQEKNITDVVFNKVTEMQGNNSIELPNNYSVGNALKSAFLILQETVDKNKRPVLEVCTKESVGSTLLDMVVQGLNPVKKQCYFIAYGNKLTLSRSYLGTVAITKRIQGVKDVTGFVIYKDDIFKLGFDFVTGKKIIKEYEPQVDKWEIKNIIGAVGLVIGEKETLHVEYMTMDQVRKAWNQGSMKGNSGAHTNFPDQMAIKTVINRACKYYANTSDDSDKIANLINSSMESTDEEVRVEIEEKANKELISVDFGGEDSTVIETIDPDTGEIVVVPDDEVEAPF